MNTSTKQPLSDAEYRKKIAEFLSNVKYNQTFTISKIVKPENLEKFISIVKEWMDSYPYADGFEFNADYTKLSKFDVAWYPKKK